MAICDVWLLVDENGDYSVGNTKDILLQRYGEEFQECICVPASVVHLKILVPQPVPIEVNVSVKGTEPVVKVEEVAINANN